MGAKINRKGDKTSKFILLYQYTKIKNLPNIRYTSVQK